MPAVNLQKFNNQIVFFGFCPGADFSKRLDTRWKQLGICEFQYFESKVQVKRFASIEVGDLIVLKKRQIIGKTMRVYGYGLVTGITKDDKGNRVLKVDWSSQEQVIEVPLMGCNATIDIRTIDNVRAEMPDEFFEWLNQGAGVSNSTKPASKTETTVLEGYEIDEDSEYNNLNPKDFETLAFSFLWVGNHIGEAAGGMSVKERMSALYACDEILASQSSDVDTSEKELFVSVLRVVGGDKAQSLLDAYNADPRSTEQGLKDTVRILTEYSESGQSGAVEQSTFFMNALIKMAQAVVEIDNDTSKFWMELSVDVSDVSLADMKIRIKAFDFIKDLVSAKVNDTKAKPETKQNKKNDKADNKTIKSTSTNIGNAKSAGCTWFVVISVSLIFFIIVLLISLWLRRDTLNPPNNSQPSDQVEEASNSALHSSSSTSELATSSDYIDPSKPAPSPEQYEPANPQDMQDSQARELIAAELEVAKAKNDELLEERALVEERRLAAASNSNYVPQDKTTKIDIIPCEYTASSPLVCESRKDQPTTCAWSYSSCGSPRLQKKLSKSSCNNRVTLDVQNSHIIVTAGCRAEFVPEIN
jgi:hypothetical protein